MHMRVAFCLMAAAITPISAWAEDKTVPVARMLARTKKQYPSPASIFNPKPIDIPQWAKDEGHNGMVTYKVGITPDGKLDAIQLFKSSGSKAIDDAAMAAITSATFLNGTDKDGKPSFDQIEITMEYERWDDESPGGGLDDYRCANLTKEYDWFTKANGKDYIFPLQNFYVARDMLDNVDNVDRRDRKATEKQRAKYTKEWTKLVKACRKTPDALLLDKVKDPETFRMWVESF